MALKDVFKVSRKTFFNPSGWLGYNEIKSYTRFLWETLKNLFIPAKPEHSETFEQALDRLHLTETDIQISAKHYLIYAIIFVVLAVGAIGYSFYLLLVHGTLAGWILSIAVAALFFSQAFRFHFWYFQIKHRKLGCTFAEWRRGKPFENSEGPPP